MSETPANVESVAKDELNTSATAKPTQYKATRIVNKNLSSILNAYFKTNL